MKDEIVIVSFLFSVPNFLNNCKYIIIFVDKFLGNLLHLLIAIALFSMHSDSRPTEMLLLVERFKVSSPLKRHSIFSTNKAVDSIPFNWSLLVRYWNISEIHEAASSSKRYRTDHVLDKIKLNACICLSNS